MAVQSYRDLIAWQKGRELTRLVYAASRTGEFAKDFALRDQIRRAVISIVSNIAEGFERGGDREFAQFLATALARNRHSRPQTAADFLSALQSAGTA